MVTEKQVALVTQTARMVVVLTRDPDHVRKPEYGALIRRNHGLWIGLSPEDQQEAAARALRIHDMSPERVWAAVAALEA